MCVYIYTCILKPLCIFRHSIYIISINICIYIYINAHIYISYLCILYLLFTSKNYIYK